jgi:hypothetical protein
MLSSYSRNGHGPAHRRRRNASLQQVIVPDWDAGVKRMARLIKQWPATEIDPERIPLYGNRNGRHRALLKLRSAYKLEVA